MFYDNDRLATALAYASVYGRASITRTNWDREGDADNRTIIKNIVKIRCII